MTSLSTTTRPEDRSDGLLGSIVSTVTLGILIAATFAWGSVSASARATLAAVLCALGCACAAVVLFRGNRLRMPAGSGAFLAFLALVFAQTVPLGFDLPPAAQAVLGLSHSDSVSLIPAATLSSGRGYLGWLVLFVVGATACAQARRMRQLPWAVLLVAAVLAVYYAIHPFLQHVPPHARSTGIDRHVFGTYLSRNHLGGLFAIAVLLGVGLFVSRRRTLCHRSPGFARRQSYIVVLASLAGLGLVLTGSRGAMIGLVAGGLLMAILLPREPNSGRRFAPLLGTLALLGLLPFTIPTELLERFLNIGHDLTSAGARAGLWSAALGLLELSPLVGNGLGTFASLSALTQPDAVVGHIEHAHCDALELLAETGLLGVNLLLWSALALAVHVGRRSRRTRGDRRTALAVAALAAVLAVLTQSIVDFDFHVPALAAWAAVLAGSASGAMATANGLSATGWLVPRWSLVPTMVALGLGAVFAGREAWSYRLLEQGADLAQAESIHPGRGEPAAGLAWRLTQTDETPQDIAAIQAAAVRSLDRNPFDSRAWHALALAAIWSRTEHPLDQMRRAVELLPPSERPRLRIDLGLELLRAGRQAAAPVWFRELFSDPKVDGLSVLRRIHTDLDDRVDLGPLVPTIAHPSLRQYAEELRQQGALVRRERILDLLLDRAPQRNRWTIRDSVTLAASELRESVGAGGRQLHIGIRLDCPADYRFDTQLMCLGLHGPEARAEHYFQPRSGTSQHVVPVPDHLPPGRYEVALQAFTNGTRFPIGFLTVEERRFHLAPGRTLPAGDLLYRSSKPAQVQRRGGGLQLTTTTRLWRPLRLGEPGGTLVLGRTDDTPLRVLFNDTPLRMVQGNDRHQHFELPAGITEGVLTILPTTGSTTVVLDVTLLAGGRR